MSQVIGNIFAATSATSPKIVAHGRQPCPSSHAHVAMAFEHNSSWMTSLRRYKHRQGLMILEPHNHLAQIGQSFRNGQLPDDYMHVDLLLGKKDERGHFVQPQEHFARSIFPSTWRDRPAYELTSLTPIIEEFCGRRILVHPTEAKSDEMVARNAIMAAIAKGDWHGVPAVLRAADGNGVFRLLAVGPIRILKAMRHKLVLGTPDGKKFVLNVPPGMLPDVGTGSLLQRGEPFFRFNGVPEGPVVDALNHTVHSRIFYSVDTDKGPVEFIRLWHAMSVAHYCGRCLSDCGIHAQGKDVVCVCGARAVPALRKALVLANSRHYLFDSALLSEENQNIQALEDISHIQQFDRQHADTTAMVKAAKEGGYKTAVRLPQSLVA